MSTQRGEKTCDCGGDEFIFVKDMNLAKVWKAGNKYARVCVDCGNRYFLGKAMWENARDQYVILEGEDDPNPIFDCPACEETVTGWPDACPYCDTEYEWGEDAKVDIGGDLGEPPEDPDEDDDEDAPEGPLEAEGLVPLGRLTDEDVDEMNYRTLQKYGAALDGMRGSGVSEAALRQQVKDRLPDDGPDDADTETQNDASA